MSNIPEDSVLKRHYLSALEYETAKRKEKVHHKETFAILSDGSCLEVPSVPQIPLSSWLVAGAILFIFLFVF